MSVAAPLQTLPDDLPIFPLAGVLLLPRGRLPLNVFEPRYKAMVEDALAGSRTIGMIQPAGDCDEVRGVGCAGRISSFSETPDGRYLICLSGICRFKVAGELAMQRGYRRVRPEWGCYVEDLLPGTPAALGERPRLEGLLRAYFRLQGLTCDWEAVERTDDEKLVNLLSMICPFCPDEKQALLEAGTVEDRAQLLAAFMELAVLHGGGGPGRCH